MNYRTTTHGALAILLAILPPALAAGPFPGAAGTHGSTAVPAGDPSIVGWATTVVDYSPGSHVDPFFHYYPDDDFVTGPATDSDWFHVASLGRGGSITLGFDPPIADGPGADFAVFENAFDDRFLELAFVEVSQDGVNFVRFPTISLTPTPVGGFQDNAMNPTDIDGFAGKYRIGFGTPFDIGILGLDWITQVRLVDVVGDGETTDTGGRPVYDPYPTYESAGFDIDAVAVINTAMTYASWLERYFTPAERAVPTLVSTDADPDRDGQSNLCEYALGGHPRDAALTGAVVYTAGQAPGDVAISFSRALVKTDVEVTVLRSDLLEGWSPLAAGLGGEPFAALPGSGALVTESQGTLDPGVTVGLPAGGAPTGFYRLRAALR
ncbi:hypothetical protein BH23VER1_BH23VER1_22480 [soil metagenome]